MSKLFKKIKKIIKRRKIIEFFDIDPQLTDEELDREYRLPNSIHQWVQSRSQMPEWMIRQEYMNEYVDPVRIHVPRNHGMSAYRESINTKYNQYNNRYEGREFKRNYTLEYGEEPPKPHITNVCPKMPLWYWVRPEIDGTWSLENYAVIRSHVEHGRYRNIPCDLLKIVNIEFCPYCGCRFEEWKKTTEDGFTILLDTKDTNDELIKLKKEEKEKEKEEIAENMNLEKYQVEMLLSNVQIGKIEVLYDQKWIKDKEKNSEENE